MEKFTLKRTGHTPIRFDGELLSSHTTKVVGKGKIQYWYELATYRTANGRYVATVTIQTTSPYQPSQTWTEVFNTPAELAHVLTTRWPVPKGIGYPPQEAFIDKHNHLMDSLTSLYDAGVSEVLTADEFATSEEDADQHVALRKAARNAVNQLAACGDKYSLAAAEQLDAVLGEAR